jgi:hypothetical protein
MSEGLNEPELENSYPVYLTYAYVCDGEVRYSPLEGTVYGLKKEFKCTKVCRCDLIGRDL